MKILPATPLQRRWMLARIGLLLLFIGLTACYTTCMPGRSYKGPLPPLTGEEQQIQTRLQAHVAMLAGTIGQRDMSTPRALEAAARYIETTWASTGYDPQPQVYVAGTRTVRNIEVSIPGTSTPSRIVIVGAHYDTVDTPGANDNASGVAALLEISSRLAGRRFPCTVRFVAFVNEEPPHHMTNSMGSFIYAGRCRERNEDIVAMMSLETLGFYSDEPGSQKYPPIFSLLYPDRANFIGFVSNVKSRSLLTRAIDSFRRHTQFPSEGVAAPAFIQGIGWSDHWSFWQFGYPGIMITDTAFFRYHHYHMPGDTPDKLDYPRLARVTAGMVRVTAELAGGAADRDSAQP